MTTPDLGPPAVLDRAWPFVGRETELARIAAALARPDAAGLLLAGPAGVGKTRLATECARIAERVGFRCARVLATRAAADVPLGALAPLLPADSRSDAPHGNWLRAAADAIAVGPGPLLLVVDDAHLLDNASATVVQQLAAPDRAFVVLTTRTGLPLPEPLLALWKDAIVERLDLAPLTASDVDRVLDLVLSGAMDGAVRMELFQASQGNALFLRELVLGGVDTGILRRDGGVWRLTRRLASSPRLVELVHGRLGDLHTAERQLLELLAIGEPLPWEIVEEFGDTTLVDGMERRGLVQTVQQRSGLQVGLAHPLYGEVLRAGMTALTRMAASRRLADAADKVGVARVSALALAVWRLDGGGAVDPLSMLDAARGARRAGDLALAERLTAAAADAGAGPAAGLLHARVLGERGQRDRAQALLAGLTAQAVTDEQRAVVAIEHSRALLYWQGHGAEATATLDDAARRLTGHWREQVVAHRGLVALMRGQLSDALHATDVLDTATPGHGLATAAATAAVAAALAGHDAEAMAYCQRAERGKEPGRARLALIVTLCESGRLAAAGTAVTTAYERALRMRSRTGQAWLSLLRGRIGLLTGQLGSAGHAFAEGQAIATQLGLLVLRRWCAAGAVLAAAQRGDTDTAAARIADLDAVPRIDLHLQEPDELRARAWMAWLRGDAATARQALTQAVAVAMQSGAGALAAAAWHDLARLGAANAAQPLVAFASGMDGELIAVRTAVVEALCCRDPHALASCADRFEALGAVLFAAESVAAAAAEHRRRGESRVAERLAERASALAGQCDRANTPALQLTGPVAELTVREREIAMLAAKGRSNRDIAETLTLSVRTVETHLQRAYTKLAVTSRAELTRVLGHHKPRDHGSVRHALSTRASEDT